jgi:uncharacterized phage-like protein YoqJ
MSPKTCCVRGHRDIPGGKLDYVKEALQKESLQAVKDGYTHFISGFSEGVDLIFASLVADLMTENPALTLEAAIPYRNRLNVTDGLFLRLIGKCGIVGVHNETYGPSGFMKRDRFMVSQARRVIAVYDGRKKGGTFFTIRYAYAQERDVRIIKV